MTKSSNLEKRPLASVVMIAYNNERYINDAIRGVMAQKGDFDIQLIICDDCSTDSTARIAADWACRYPSAIELYRNPHNLGVQGNYLEAFTHVRGDYMAMCDADDYWTDPHKLARQISYMERHPECSVTFHRVVNYYEDSGVKSLSNGSQKEDCTIADLASMNFITNMSVVYRRRCVDLSALPDWLKDVRLVDYPMHMFYAAHGSVHYFNRPMGVYRQTASAIWSMTEMVRRQEMSLIVRLHLINYFKDNEAVVKRLRLASRSILTSMIAGASNYSLPEEKIAGYAAEIDPELTVAELRKDATGLQSGRTVGKFIRRMLRWGRIQASRLVPVPRPPKISY